MIGVIISIDNEEKTFLGQKLERPEGGGRMADGKAGSGSVLVKRVPRHKVFGIVVAKKP